MTIKRTDIIDGLKVARAAKCRTVSGDSYQVQFTIDFSGCTIGDLIEWSTSTKVIAGQRAWEKYTHADLTANVEGKTFMAKTIGQKIKTDAEIEAEMKALAMNNPEHFKRILMEMEKVEKENK